MGEGGGLGGDDDLGGGGKGAWGVYNALIMIMMEFSLFFVWSWNWS